MTFNDFVLLFANEVGNAVRQGQRPGQFAVNLLGDHRTDIAAAIIRERHWDADCYYDDSKLPTFWTKVGEMWDNPISENNENG